MHARVSPERPKSLRDARKTSGGLYGAGPRSEHARATLVSRVRARARARVCVYVRMCLSIDIRCVELRLARY